MNLATAIIATDHRESTLAERILAGGTPLADWPIYSPEDWEREAQAAIDTGDDTELLWMLAEQHEADREEERLRRAAYSGRAPSRRSWVEVG